MTDYKQIKEEIFTKFNTKFSKFLPANIKYFVAGGVFPRLYHNLQIRDLDVFVVKTDDFNEICSFFDNKGFYRIKNEQHLVKFQIPNEDFSIDVVNNLGPKLKDPIGFVSRFDFTISRIYASYSNYTGFLEIEDVSLQDFLDIHNKNLKFTGKLLFGSKDNNTITRLLKYAQLGFQISEDDYKNIGSELFTKLRAGVKAGAFKPEEIGSDTYDTPFDNNNTNIRRVTHQLRLDPLDLEF